MKISTLNPIAQVGLNQLPETYEITDDFASCDAVLVRSAKMHDMELPGQLLAVARAGAGVNNIPLDKCAENGTVVFNTPGANANGVKELEIVSGDKARELEGALTDQVEAALVAHTSAIVCPFEDGVSPSIKVASLSFVICLVLYMLSARSSFAANICAVDKTTNIHIMIEC